MRSLQPAVKSEDVLVVPGGGFEIGSKILGCEGALMLSGSFVSATLSSINN